MFQVNQVYFKQWEEARVPAQDSRLRVTTDFLNRDRNPSGFFKEVRFGLWFIFNKN